MMRDTWLFALLLSSPGAILIFLIRGMASVRPTACSALRLGTADVKPSHIRLGLKDLTVEWSRHTEQKGLQSRH